MASRHIDGVREIQRYSEGKVYRRKVFKGIKINLNIEETVLKDENIPTTIVTSDTDNNNGTTLENIDEAPEFAVLGDGNLAKAEGSSRLEDGSSIQQQLGDQNLVEEHASSRTGDRNSPQQQLEELNSAQPHASFQLADGNSPQQKVENQDSAHPQASLRIGDGNSPQQQLVEPNLAQPQASLRAGDGNSPQRQLEEENSAQPQASSRTGDGNLPHQQLEDQYSAQPPASLRIGDGISLRQKVEGHNLVKPQASSIIEDGNSPRQKTEDQSLAQPPVSSRTDDGDSAQQQVEDQNLAQTHVSSRTEDVNSPRPQNSTQKDGDSPQILENSRPEDASLTQPEVNSRLEDRSFPQPELNSKLEDRTSQQQDNSILEDGNSSQPQLNLRLEGSSLQPVANSTSEDLNLAQPLSQSVSDDLHINQQAEPSNLNVRQEDDRPSSPIHRQGAISDNLHSHQQVEPSNPNVLLEDDGPLSPIHRHKAVPSTEYRHSENVTEEPNLEDRIKINLASTSKQEKQEMCLKLESELDAVRSLVKRIEVKQGYVGGYGNSNVVLGGGITNGGGAQRAHSEAGSVGVSRQPTRPLHQLSFPMFQNSRRASEGVEKEKRMPKANQFYHNSEFLLANDKFPPAESNKKSKLNWKKQGGGDMGLGLQMGSKFFKSCSSLLEKLMKHQYAWVFNTPVDVDGLGLHDYFTIITNPMDLGTVKTRLNKNWYKSPKEFAEDVRLTFHNAMTYNPKGQDVHAMAEQLSKIFEDRWAIIESDYNREMRYGMDYGAPSPLSRRVPAFTPPPPLDMRRILDRQEPFARTPRSMNNTPSSRTPAPKKPKAKDPNKRDMTYDEKQKLSTSLQSLPVEKLDAVVQMMRKKNLELNQQDDEIEVDFDAVDAEILWELDRFVLNYKKSLSKNKRKAEQARERAEALQNSVQSSQPPATAQIPREKQADERNVPPSLPMQGGSQADNKSRSSSSSSDSGSSSSDSDSDSSSSSGSDAGSRGT